MPLASCPPGENCPKCEKKVYGNEAKLGGGYKWHPMCFKCSQCNMLLDSTKCAEHHKELYCKSCYDKHHGITRKLWALSRRKGHKWRGDVERILINIGVYVYDLKRILFIYEQGVSLLIFTIKKIKITPQPTMCVILLQDPITALSVCDHKVKDLVF